MNRNLIGLSIGLVSFLTMAAPLPTVHSSTPPDERVRLIAPVKEGELRVRSTFCACGVSFGSRLARPGLKLEWRAAGGAWRAVPDFPYFAETRDYRGSILGLEEDCGYDVRIVADGQTLASASTRTWASEVPIAKTVTLDPAKMTFPLKISDRGSPEGWIRYTAPEGSVIRNATDRPTVVVEDAAYVILEGLAIEGGRGRHSIELARSRAVRIRNCELYGWGRDTVVRYDGLGRPFVPGSPRPEIYRNVHGGFSVKAKGEVNFDGAIEIGPGCAETVVERCYVHDSRIHSNSWYYSHPAGCEAVTAKRPDHSTVIRYNDFIGSDLHRFNDAVESHGNFVENGGLNRDADVYGNFMIFCADDCIELDGGQQNVRCFGNRFEAALCGVSIQGCMASPVYVYDNVFASMCDEFGNAGQTLKTGGGAHGEEARAYFWRNLLWGAGTGVTCMTLLQLQSRDNVFCGRQRLTHADCSPQSSSKGDRFGVEMAETALPKELRQSPVGFVLDRSRFGGITLRGGTVSPRTLTVRATSTVGRRIPFAVRKNADFPWLKVEPTEGFIPAEGALDFTVSFDTALMTDRRDYRGAFIVRTPEGLSRGVSVYVETDFVPPFRAERPGDVAVYAENVGAVKLAKGEPAERQYAFVVPKDGRYHFLLHARAEGRPGGGKTLSAALDDEPFELSTSRLWSHPVWTPVAPGNRFGNTLRFWDFKAGERHVLKIRSAEAAIAYDGVVMTDNPGSFEPR